MHFPGIRPDGYYSMEKWNMHEAHQVDVLLGACILFRKAALDNTGLFDDDFFIYSEEVDLCRRLKQAQWELYWLPVAEVIHYGGQSTKQLASEMFHKFISIQIPIFL